MTVFARLLVPLLLAVFGVVYYLQAGAIRSQYSQGPIGPGDVPKMYVVALGVALVFVVVTDLRRPRVEGAPLDWGGLLAALAVVAASALYIALFRPLGYLLATAIYSLILLAIFARLKMRPLRMLAQTAGLVAAVYLLFGVLFDVRLPEGTLFEAQLAAPSTPATPAEGAR